MPEINYILHTSDEELTRLTIQAGILNRYSASFLGEFIRPGQQVLEIGCGTGAATTLIAGLLNGQGHLTAIDQAERYVPYAQQRIQLNGYTNVTIQQQTVQDLKGKNCYDVIYGRAILHHIPDPQQAIRQLLPLLKLGGIVAFEEPIIPSAFCVPANAAYTRSLELYVECGKRNHIDLSMGNKLHTYFLALGIKPLLSSLIQPTLLTPRERSLMPRFVRVMREQYLAAGLISAADMAQMQQQIDEVCAGTDMMAYIQFHQIFGVYE